MIKRPRGGVEPHERASDVVDDASELRMLRARVGDLEREVATLRAGLVTRQRIGFVTGVLGQRFSLSSDEAWALLARVSQTLNVKAQRVAEVLMDVYNGRLALGDVKLASRIFDLLHQALSPTDPQDPTGAGPDAQDGDVSEPTRPA